MADFLDGSPAAEASQELNGTLLAPSGTQSARFWVAVGQQYDDFCSFWASFDDLDLLIAASDPTAVDDQVRQKASQFRPALTTT